MSFSIYNIFFFPFRQIESIFFHCSLSGILIKSLSGLFPSFPARTILRSYILPTAGRIWYLHPKKRAPPGAPLKKQTAEHFSLKSVCFLSHAFFCLFLIHHNRLIRLQRNLSSLYFLFFIIAQNASVLSPFHLCVPQNFFSIEAAD